MVNNTNIEKYDERRISVYAPRAEVREAMERFKAGLQVKDASEHEYAALAHVSLKYDIDPFNGEAWIIPGKGMMVGIKGLRKMANRQAKEGDFRWWTEFQDVRNPQEAELYGVPDNVQIAKVCILRRSDHIESWANALKMIREAAPDFPFERIDAAIGKPPQFVGIGYVQPGESSRMPLGQLAMKRAEAHAIKQAFDVEQSTEGDEAFDHTTVRISRGDDDGDDDPPKPQLPDKSEAIEGTVTEPVTKSRRSKPPLPHERTDNAPDPPTMRKGPEADALHRRQTPPDPPTADPTPIMPDRPMQPEELAAWVDVATDHKGINGKASEKQKRALYGLLGDVLDNDKDRAAYLSYVTGGAVSKVDELGSSAASVLIDLLKAPDGWDVSEAAKTEAARVLREALKAQGQQDLPGLDDDTPEPDSDAQDAPEPSADNKAAKTTNGNGKAAPGNVGDEVDTLLVEAIKKRNFVNWPTAVKRLQRDLGLDIDTTTLLKRLEEQGVDDPNLSDHWPQAVDLAVAAAA